MLVVRNDPASPAGNRRGQELVILGILRNVPRRVFWRNQCAAGEQLTQALQVGSRSYRAVQDVTGRA
jgi:hypothetical protein